MIGRRDLLLGGGAIAAAGVAYGLRPRRRLVLLRSEKMGAIFPKTVGSWTAVDDPNLVAPRTEGTLSAKLYSEVVERVYTDAVTGAEIMMLIAYGSEQSDLLQLHRPESCYPAVGFSVKSTRPENIPLTSGAAITGRRVVAEMGDRRENIIYWTRLGEYLPADSGKQRMARLLSSMNGYIPDGALFRFSEVNADPEKSFATIESFIREAVLGMNPANRPALLGSALAAQVRV
ncbi:MAG: exosortase-associated protein EpsI, V-type [Phenylobacterium sp.]